MPKSNGPNPKKQRKIYLDYASGALSASPNAGAIHELGLKEKSKLENARKKVSDILNIRREEVVFTFGATESNNLAILGLIQNFQNGSRLPHITTTNIEHASVLEVCKHLEKTKKAKVTYVEVESNGVVDPKKIKKAITKDTVFVSVMYANNEIGTIQPIAEIAKEIRHYKKTNNQQKIFFHTDATQAINYLPISMPKLGVDMMSFNAAKIYGPKGVGALYVKKGTPVSKIMFGGDQEFGLRPGTENVAGSVALAKALGNVEKIKDKEEKRLNNLQNYFVKKLQEDFSNILINGDLKNRLPNNINITIPNIPSDLLVIELSAKGIMASAKSACKSGDGKASHVIQAISLPAQAGKNIKPARNATHSVAGGETDGSIRFSLGRDTTKGDIDYTLKILKQILTKLEKWYN